MNNKFVFLFFALVFSSVLARAQQALFPVVFHVLYMNASQNLPDTVLQHQVDVLQEDYNMQNADLVNVPAVWQPIIGNMGIGFQMATVDPNGNPTNGIERRQVSQWPSNGNAACTYALGGLDAWPDTAYLNVWVYNLQGPLAYTAFPSASFNACRGLYIDYRVVGRNDANQNAPYTKGRTATHELGHFFGLYHIWGDDAGTCSGTDYIADTPNQAGETFGDPGVGTVVTDQCSPTAPGIMWMNFLDFTDDAGMCMFTQGQVTAVTNVINTYYQSFRLPSGITSTAPPPVSAYAVFPSPSAGIFQINRTDVNTKTTVEVYDLQGRQMMAPVQFENGSTTLQLNLSAFATGTYSFVIRTEDAVETKRVVIAR